MSQEVILLSGIMAGGKSSQAVKYIESGYVCLSRDKLGGKIIDLVPKLGAELIAGKSVVLDNTFGTKSSRQPFIEMSIKHNVPIRCIHVDTKIEDAQFNAAKRMVGRYGRLFGPEELSKHKDPNIFPVTVLFAYQKSFELPTKEEGFAEVVNVQFVREKDPNLTKKALLIDFDGTLRTTISGRDYPIESSDIKILPGRKEKLQEYKDQGYLLLGVSNQSGVAKGTLSNGAAKACFEKTCKLLGHEIDYFYCPHGSFPIACYCRKPFAGAFVQFQLKYNLNPDLCLMVGDLKTDETFSKRAGIRFIHADRFFV